MKSLLDYIKEAREVETIEEGKDCSSIKINFDGMDGADDFIKSIESFQSVSVAEKEVEILCDANVEELKKIYDLLKKYSDKERTSSHRASDEQYAQKTVKFENKVKELNEMIEKIEKPEEQSADPDKKKEDKKDDEKKDDKKKEEE